MHELQSDIVAEFNHFSEEYTSGMCRMVPHYSQLISSIVESIPTDSNAQNILDLGCGNGNVTNELIRQFPDASYHLVDASPEMMKACRSRFATPKMKYTQCFFQDLKLKHQSLDVVVASFSLHHVNSKEKQSIFKKIFGWLKSNGLFVSADLMINKMDKDHPQLLKDWKTYALSQNASEEDWQWLMEHYEAFDQPDNFNQQMKWLKNAGFKKVEKFWFEGYWVCLRAIK